MRFLELTIGLSGLLLTPLFSLLERIDTAMYASWPSGAIIWHLAGIAAILGPPAVAMGASLPVFGLIGQRFRMPVSAIYSWNTAGAAAGVIAAAFLMLPALGMFLSGMLIALVNCIIAIAAWWLPCPRENDDSTVTSAAASEADKRPTPIRAPREGASLSLACLDVFATGFATFGLEVAWFRSLRAAYFSTTYTFAILLAAVLVPLAFAAEQGEPSARPRVAAERCADGRGRCHSRGHTCGRAVRHHSQLLCPVDRA